MSGQVATFPSGAVTETVGMGPGPSEVTTGPVQRNESQDCGEPPGKATVYGPSSKLTITTSSTLPAIALAEQASAPDSVHSSRYPLNGMFTVPRRVFPVSYTMENANARAPPDALCRSVAVGTL